MNPSDQSPHPSLGKTGLVFDIGVKCNTQSIRRRLGIPAYSSPFDNMDSVHGLRDIARLLSDEQNSYFLDKDKWVIRNDYAPRSPIVRAKVVYHCDFPGLFYPHFHAGWFDDISPEDLQKWQNNPDCSLDLIWEGFRSTFKRRLDRLRTLFRDGQKIIFLRVDEARSIQRIYAHGNTNHDIDFFSRQLVNKGLTNFKMLYLYAESTQYNRSIQNNQLVEAIPISLDAEYDKSVDIALTSRLRCEESNNR